MSVLVYSGDVLVEEVRVESEEQMEKVASYWQDEGYRVRVQEGE